MPSFPPDQWAVKHEFMLLSYCAWAWRQVLSPQWFILMKVSDRIAYSRQAACPIVGQKTKIQCGRINVIKRIREEGGLGPMNFNDLFQHLCRQLKKRGFTVTVEDNYPDFKSLFADHEHFHHDIFRMVDIVLSDNGDFHFMFHTRKGRRRQLALTRSDFQTLKSFVEDVFKGSENAKRI